MLYRLIYRKKKPVNRLHARFHAGSRKFDGDGARAPGRAQVPTNCGCFEHPNYCTGMKGDELESKPRCCGDISVTASAVRMFILEVCVQNRGGIRNNTRLANVQRVIWYPA